MSKLNIDQKTIDQICLALLFAEGCPVNIAIGILRNLTPDGTDHLLCLRFRNLCLTAFL